jgi:cell division GTPase FtsZ
MQTINGHGDNMSRVVILDEKQQFVRTKTPAEIVKENEEFLKLLKGEKEMVDQNELKEAMRQDDFSAIVAKKKAEAAAKQTTESSTTDAQGEDMSKNATAKPHVSLQFGVVGSGQAGGRIAEVFYRFGYQACAINTAMQDMEFLDMPKESKFFLNYSLGGAGRDLEVGRAAIENQIDEVRAFLQSQVGNSDVILIALAGGGGSGSGSAETLVSLVAELGRPVGVIYALPGTFDDSQSKHNAIQTLAKLSDMSAKGVINSLILVDNAKIEAAYPGLSQASFWETANNAIVEPLHMFNSLTAMPTNFEALDSMDFAKSFIEAGNCVLFGSNKVSKELYDNDETSLVGAIIEDLDKGLLASSFDLKEAQAVGILVTARQAVLEKVPYHAISYIFRYIAEEYKSARTFKGVYAVPSTDDDITVRFIFSGLGLPKKRVESLKNEAQRHMQNLEAKKGKAAVSMSIDLGKDKTTSEVDRIMKKIEQKKSATGKLLSNKFDRRR